MNWKKIGGVALVVFIGWYIIKSPSAAAGTWHAIANAFSNAASSVTTFLSQATG